MKLKFDLGKGGLKGLLINHAEKGLFAIVLLLVVLFVFRSATQEEFQGTRPQQLEERAESARNKLSQDYWDALKDERETKVVLFPKQVELGRKPIDSQGYAFVKTWDKDMVPNEKPRTDPELLPPIDVEATGGLYAVAIRSRNPVDPFADDKDAVKEEEKERPKRRKPKRRSTGGYGYGDEEGYGYGEEGYGEEGYGEEGYGYGDEESEYSGYPGMTGAGQRRQLGSFYRKHYLQGFKAGGGYGGGPAGTIARSFGVVSVKALVPYEKQWEAYEKALAEAKGYSPEVDIPKYLYFIAERADVDLDDPDAEPAWKTISNSQVAMKAVQLYAGMPQEIADMAYLSPGVLTMPIPPVLVRPYDSLALHSEVPRKQVRMALTDDELAEDETSAEEQLTAGVTDTGEGVQGMSAIPTTPLRSGYGSEYGSGYGSEYGSGYGEEDYESEYGSEYGYGEEYGEGYGYGGSPAMRPLVKYKLVRFFDFSAKPGKSYRYRVRVALEDPNHPQNPQAEPNSRILDPAVRERLATVKEEEAALLAQGAAIARKFYLETEWSEPSNIVTVASPVAYVAGGVESGRIGKLSPDRQFELSEATGKLVTMVWDEKRATEVAAERAVLRGSFLDFTQSADVLNPLTLQLKTIENHEFDTNALVVDIRGGQQLIEDVDEDTKEKTIRHVPGEFLIVDANGNLIACNEIDDAEEYRRLLFIEDSPPAPSSSSMDEYYGEESYGDEYESGYGYGAGY